MYGVTVPRTVTICGFRNKGPRSGRDRAGGRCTRASSCKKKKKKNFTGLERPVCDYGDVLRP